MTAPGLRQIRDTAPVSSLPPRPRWALCDRCDRCDLALDPSRPLCRICDPQLAAWIAEQRQKRAVKAAAEMLSRGRAA